MAIARKINIWGLFLHILTIDSHMAASSVQYQDSHVTCSFLLIPTSGNTQPAAHLYPCRWLHRCCWEGLPERHELTYSVHQNHRHPSGQQISFRIASPQNQLAHSSLLNSWRTP